MQDETHIEMRDRDGILRDVIERDEREMLGEMDDRYMREGDIER